MSNCVCASRVGVAFSNMLPDNVLPMCVCVLVLLSKLKARTATTNNIIITNTSEIRFALVFTRVCVWECVGWGRIRSKIGKCVPIKHDT